jgi:hypothetical protein
MSDLQDKKEILLKTPKLWTFSILMPNYKDKPPLNKMKKEEKPDKLSSQKKEIQKANKLLRKNLKEKPQENG